MVVCTYDALRLTPVKEVLNLLNQASREQNINMINKCSQAIGGHGYRLSFDKHTGEYVIIKK